MPCTLPSDKPSENRQQQKAQELRTSWQQTSTLGAAAEYQKPNNPLIESGDFGRREIDGIQGNSDSAACWRTANAIPTETNDGSRQDEQDRHDSTSVNPR